jgi:hypothetical protein
MKKKIFNLLLVSTFFCFGQKEGPIVLNKLDNPEPIKKITIQKRSQTWIEGQWNVDNNNYKWVTGHWVPKRVGYRFINGLWIEKGNGWVWRDGYWETVPIKKWKLMYS